MNLVFRIRASVGESPTLRKSFTTLNETLEKIQGVVVFLGKHIVLTGGHLVITWSQNRAVMSDTRTRSKRINVVSGST